MSLEAGSVTDAERHEITLSDLQRVKLEPGDVLVLRVNGRLSAVMAEQLRAQVTACFPGHRALVLEQDAALAVVSGHGDSEFVHGASSA